MKLLELVDNKTITSEDLEVFKKKLDRLKELKAEAEETLEQVKKLLEGKTQGIIEKGLEYQVRGATLGSVEPDGFFARVFSYSGGHGAIRGFLLGQIADKRKGFYTSVGM